VVKDLTDEGKQFDDDGDGEIDLTFLHSFDFEKVIYRRGNAKDVYKVEFVGWVDGLFGGEKGKYAYQHLDDVYIKIIVDDVKSRGNNEAVKYEPMHFSSCLHLVGEETAPFGVVNMIAKSDGGSQKNLLFRGIDNYNYGFNKIEPFGNYSHLFRHYVDLKIHDDSDWGTTTYLGIAKKSFYLNKYLKKVPKISECGSEETIYNFYNKKAEASYTSLNQETVFLSNSPSPEVTIHEAGHAFVGLLDEYYYGGTTYSKEVIDLINVFMKLLPLGGDKNCMKNLNWEGYGELDLNDPGCTIYRNFYRPSENSLMKSIFDPRFNVVSCGYILMRLQPDKTNIIEAWERCMQIQGDIIKPPIIQQT